MNLPGRNWIFNGQPKRIKNDRILISLGALTLSSITVASAWQQQQQKQQPITTDWAVRSTGNQGWRTDTGLLLLAFRPPSRRSILHNRNTQLCLGSFEGCVRNTGDQKMMNIESPWNLWMLSSSVTAPKVSHCESSTAAKPSGGADSDLDSKKLTTLVPQPQQQEQSIPGAAGSGVEVRELEHLNVKHPHRPQYQEMRLPNRAESSNHAVYGALMRQPGYLLDYRVYRRAHHSKTSSRITTSDEDDLTHHPIPLVVAVAQLGNKLDGHEGIVHGGILALLVDDVLGFAYEAIPIPMAMTANLNLNFRRPLLPHTKFLVQAFLDEQVGRKLLFTVRVTSVDNSILYCEGTSLYVIPKDTLPEIPKDTLPEICARL